MPLPEGPGHSPSFELSYSSGVVDGINELSNPQASRVGLGWSEPAAMITRATSQCDAHSASVLCAAHGRHDGFSLTFNGVSSALVRLTGDAGYDHPDYPSSDGVKAWDYVTELKNSWRVRRVEQPSAWNTPEGNGDVWTSWWEVTTGDGTLFVFGRERVFVPTQGSGPATTWQRGSVRTDTMLYSQQSVPLWFPASDTRMGCASGYCMAGVAWHLDQVIDTSGNLALYFYGNEWNYFEPPGLSYTQGYDREVRLIGVHWGLRYGDTPPAWNGSSPFRVKFDYWNRDDKPNFYCSSPGVETTCQQTPSFYSTVRLGMVSVIIGGTYEHGWVLSHEHSSDSKLWLTQVQRVEQQPGAPAWTTQATIPPVKFSKKSLNNRAESGDELWLPRVETMTTEPGAKITFTYGQSHAPGSSGCVMDGNEVRRPCDMYRAGYSWWNKYKVTAVTVDPRDGYSQQMVTSYVYPSGPDWAWRGSGGQGSWSDYRGHRLVEVHDGTGNYEIHTFYTGMAADRTSVSDDRPLSETAGSSEPAVVQDPWGQWRPNDKTLAGRTLGVTSRAGTRTQHQQVVHYTQDTVHDMLWGADGYDTAYALTKTLTFDQIFNGESTYAARTQLEEHFDNYGRPIKTLDHGVTRYDGDDTSMLVGDERSDYTTYVVGSPSPSSSGSWLIGSPASTESREGLNQTGTRLGYTEFSYDNKGRVTQLRGQRTATSGDYEKTDFTYTATGQVASKIERGDNTTGSDDQTTTYAYDSTYGWLKETNGPLAGDVDRSTFTVDPTLGVRTSETDPNGRTTSYTYDAHGRLKTVRLPGAPQDSYRVWYHIDQDGIDVTGSSELFNEWGATDDDRYVKSWVFYDGLGREIQSQARHQGDDNQRAVVSTRYDNVGRVWQTTLPVYQSGTPGWYYGQPWTNPGVAHSVYSYPDWTTNPQHSEGCQGGVNTEISHRTDTNTEWATTLTTVCGLTTRAWDRDGRLTTTVSDIRGNLVSSTDPAGATTAFDYNQRDELIEVTDPVGNTTIYDYGNANTYGPVSVDDPDLGTNTFAYDGHGRIEQTTDARNVELAFGYDHADRPTDVWHVNSGSSKVSQWAYDAAGAFGRLSQAVHYNTDTGGTGAGTVTESFTYDNRGRTASVTYSVPGMPGGDKTISYDYFEHDQIHNIYYPDGTSVNYGYDRAGRASWMGLTDPNNPVNPNQRTVVNYTAYTAADQLAVLKRGASGSPYELNTYYAFNDHDGSLYSAYTDTGAGTALEQYFRYDYSDAGLVSSIFEAAADGSTTQCHDYDNGPRLSAAWTLGNTNSCQQVGSDGAGPDPFEVAYTYDQLGRITTATGTGTPAGGYTYNAGPVHAPGSAGTNTYSYDSAGNRTGSTTTAGTRSYVYDVHSRMQTVAGATTAAMLYDTTGQRVKRTVNGTTNYYLTSGLELDATGTATISLGLADQQVATYRAGEIFTHNTDQLGTSTLQNDGSGQGAYTRNTPFGTSRGSIPWSQLASDLGFTGQRNDLDLDLMYYNARYYDPALGQFNRPDPITARPATAAGWNRYAYVQNNPLSYTDPSGYAGKVEAGGYLDYVGCNSNGYNTCYWGYRGDFNYGGPIGQTKFEVVILAIQQQCGTSCTNTNVNWLLNYDEVDVLAEWNRRNGSSNPGGGWSPLGALGYYGDGIPDFPLENQIRYAYENRGRITGNIEACILIVCGAGGVQDGTASVSWGFGLAVYAGANAGWDQPIKPAARSGRTHRNRLFFSLGPLGVDEYYPVNNGFSDPKRAVNLGYGIGLGGGYITQWTQRWDFRD
jgi:RHS repeat-associated protein